MKRLIYSCIAVCALIFTSCADQDVTENINGGESKPGVTVSMSLEGNMQGNQTAPASRANTNIGYKTDEATGFPTPVGLFDAVGNNGKELAEGTKVPVVLIFRNVSNDSSPDQPITKVETKWTYHKGGNLTLEPSSTFDMEAGTDLTKGTWYVCGILGGEFLKGLNQVKINPFSEGHIAKANNGQEVTWGANIPYIFGWRELVAKSKTTFKAKDNKPVRFKQFGTIVRLKVTNKTGFNFKYNGVRIITSNILCGQFDLTAFDDKTLVPTLKDTKDGDVETPTSEDYKNVFKPFKFYQRPTTDNAIVNTLATRNRYRVKGDFNASYNDEKNSPKVNTALTYYDHTFKDRVFDDVPNDKEAPSYIYVWMAPQKQTVNIYEKEEYSGNPVKTEQISKTQFLLMAVPTETSSGNKVVPKSINMIPAYGTRADYVSGVNYSARGSVVYKFPPLSYIAKHDNFGSEADLSNESNQDKEHTTRYSYNEVLNNSTNTSMCPSDYMLANQEYWRSIISQAYAFSGLRLNGVTPYYNYSIGVVSPARLPGWSKSLLVFHSYSKGINNGDGSFTTYMIGMSKQPDYITKITDGQVYQGRVTNPIILTRAPSFPVASSGMSVTDWVSTNNYRYTIRYQKMSNGTVEMKQRYLGPRFVLDMEDIDNEDFWADPSNGTTPAYPQDTKRIIPLPGVYIFATQNVSGGQRQFWFLDQNSVGNSAQYWTLDEASHSARYAQGKTGVPVGDYTEDSGNKAPLQSVGFGMPDASAGMGGFFYYLLRNAPVNQTKDASEIGVTDPRYVKGLIMKAPVRLWRKATPYSD